MRGSLDAFQFSPGRIPLPALSATAKCLSDDAKEVVLWNSAAFSLFPQRAMRAAISRPHFHVVPLRRSPPILPLRSNLISVQNITRVTKIKSLLSSGGEGWEG